MDRPVIARDLSTAEISMRRPINLQRKRTVPLGPRSLRAAIVTPKPTGSLCNISDNVYRDVNHEFEVTACTDCSCRQAMRSAERTHAKQISVLLARRGAASPLSRYACGSYVRCSNARFKEASRALYHRHHLYIQIRTP